MVQVLRLSQITGLFTTLLLSATFAAACGPSGGGGATGGGGGDNSMGGGGSADGGIPTVPTVLVSTPLHDATGVPTNGYVSVTFSEAMDSAKLTEMTFTLTSGAAEVPVPGKVTYAKSTAVYWPAVHLASNTTFTATITEGATSASGIPLAAKYTWSFTTGDMVGPVLPVDLGTAGDFVILSKTGISTVPNSTVTGNLGVSPAAASYITGFSLSADSTNVFSTSAQVTGKVYAADYEPPTPSNLTTAVADMEIAFTAAAARAPDVTELGAGDIGGMTLTAGVYKWGTGVLIPTNVTLNGSGTDVWIFQVAQSLTVGSGVKISLTGGALSKNVFWQVAGLVDIGTTAQFEGVVLTQKSVTLNTGASLNGRLLAQTAVGLSGNTVVEPAP